MRRILPLLLLAACHSTGNQPAPSADTHAQTRSAAIDLRYTETFEIRFGDELVGYLREVKPVPLGEQDGRAFPPGTSLIESKDFELLGFLSPGGTTYRFNDAGEAKAVGFGSRNQSIASFFRKNGEPRLLALGTGKAQG
jgi:hypothetical protein